MTAFRDPIGEDGGEATAGLPRALPYGLADAALASLATFAVGIVAARNLSPADLGAYAIFLSAFLLAAALGAQLVFVPAEVVVASEVHRDKLGSHRRTLRFGALLALPSLGFVGLALLVAAPQDPSVRVALSLTAAATVILSPIQDHMRRLFHLANASPLATVTSFIQVSVAVAALLALLASPLNAAWVPFGALSLANLVSLAAAVVLARRRSGKDEYPELRLVRLLRRGRWLITSAALVFGGSFVASVFVRLLAGAEWLGYSEAARVVAQPVFVLAMGIYGVIGPRSVAAGAQADLDAARRLSRLFWILMSAIGLLALAIAGGAWPWNPMLYLVPKAYEVTGLVPLAILAVITATFAWPLRSELLGARLEPRIARIDTGGTVVMLAVSSTANVTRAYAMPLGGIAATVVRGLGCWIAVRALYPERGLDRARQARQEPP